MFMGVSHGSSLSPLLKLLNCGIVEGRVNSLKKLRLASFSIFIWTLWKEHNSRIFNNFMSSMDELQEFVLLRLSWWIKGWNCSFPYSSMDFIREPSCLLWNAQARHASPSLPQAWLPPIGDGLKWNIYASFDSSLHRAAVGGVLRKTNGIFICIFSTPLYLSWRLIRLKSMPYSER